MTWRVGTKLGRTLYRDDVLVGLADTPELAAEIVAACNSVLRPVVSNAVYVRTLNCCCARQVLSGQYLYCTLPVEHAGIHRALDEAGNVLAEFCVDLSKRVEDLEANAEAWKLMAEGRSELLVCYRMGTHPKESTFAKIDKARAALETT